MDNEYTVAECLRHDGFDNVDECGFTSQDYQGMVEMRSARNDSERLCSFFQGMTRLSDNAKKIINLVLDPPCNLEEFMKDKTLTRRALVPYLQSHGWKKWVVWETFREISNFLKKFGTL